MDPQYKDSVERDECDGVIRNINGNNVEVTLLAQYGERNMIFPTGLFLGKKLEVDDVFTYHYWRDESGKVHMFMIVDGHLGKDSISSEVNELKDVIVKKLIEKFKQQEDNHNGQQL